MVDQIVTYMGASFPFFSGLLGYLSYLSHLDRIYRSFWPCLYFISQNSSKFKVWRCFKKIKQRRTTSTATFTSCCSSAPSWFCHATMFTFHNNYQINVTSRQAFVSLGQCGAAVSDGTLAEDHDVQGRGRVQAEVQELTL